MNVQLILYQPIQLQLLRKNCLLWYGYVKGPAYQRGECPRIGFIPIWNWVRDSLKPEHLKITS